MDAQRKLTDADASYYRSLVEYTLAIKNIHLQKGSLLELNEVFLAEGVGGALALYPFARVTIAKPIRPCPLSTTTSGVARDPVPRDAPDLIV